MKIYKQADYDTYHGVFHRENNEVWIVKASDKSFGKWAIYKIREDKFKKEYPENKEFTGRIPSDVTKRMIEAIFTVPSATLNNPIWG